MMSAEPRW